MRDRLARLVRWAPVAVWMGAIFLFSSRVDLPHPPQPWSDSLLRKSAHSVEFGVLGLLLVRALVVCFVNTANYVSLAPAGLHGLPTQKQRACGGDWLARSQGPVA